MTKEKLKKVILACCDDVIFTYNGKFSGITSEVQNYVPTFQAWHGSDTKDFTNVDDLMSDPFFSGKTISELIGEVDFTFA